MVAVSILTLIICGGGYTDRNSFEFVGLLLVMFWGLPLIGLITLFHFLDWRFGSYARYPIALLGLFPFLLIIYLGGQGNGIYMGNIVFSGLAWSAAWLATSHIFFRVPHAAAAFVFEFLLMLPWAWIVIAAVTGHASLGQRRVERAAPRDEPKFFGEITGAKVLRCPPGRRCIVICREHRCELREAPEN
jgi:hypothetical protein